ncbi:MAG: hypothetical protein ABI597_09830 [Gammaproteobacteria bacterium]
MSTWNKDAIILDLWMGEVLHLADHIGKNSKSDCFNYLLRYQKYFTFEISSYMGVGHTSRWGEHRRAKKEYTNLSFWTPYYKLGDKTELMPWNEIEVKEDDEASPAKKHKF